MSDIDRLRTLIERRFGLLFDETKRDLLAEVLARRIHDTRTEAAAYLALLDSAAARDELRALADRLTVAETYFFRYAEQFRALADTALPERLQARAGARDLSILSAGCASGDEPYSIAILLHERIPDIERWNIRIHAVDVSPSAIRKAERAGYSEWSMREMPTELRLRYFTLEGGQYVLAPHVRRLVTFEERNLTVDDPAFWRPNAFDVVFCRNVVMYFSPEAARRVIARIAQALAPAGFLFLGHAETLRGLSNDYRLRHSHDTFYYQRREGASEPLLPEPPPSAPPILETNTDWMDAIQRASERIADLATRSARPPASPAREPDLSVALDLVRQERFAEAIEQVPDDAAASADARLLRAALLTNAGRPKEAEEVCRRLLSGDDLNAGAHYLMALCREHERDVAGALDHDRKAIHLDAAFAMPHLHWGLIAKRTADVAIARRELAAAGSLLGREDASRILLFGGGFTRQALIDLCRSELAACGGAQ